MWAPIEWLVGVVWEMCSWMFRGLYHILSGIFYAWIRNAQTVFSWFAVVAVWALMGVVKIVDYALAKVIELAGQLVSYLDIDPDVFNAGLELAGDAVYVGNIYFGMTTLLGVIYAYVTLLAAVYAVKVVVRLIPTVG